MEIRSIEYVPLAERRGHGKGLWPIWFTGSTNLTTMAVGLIGIGADAGLFWTALAIVAGSALGTLIVAGHGAQGPRLGLPQLIQARSQFGYYGALLVYAVALISYVGYNAFGQILAGQTLETLSGIPEKGGALAMSLAAIAIAIVGFRLFKALQRWLAIALIAGLGIYSLELIASLPMAAPGPFKPAPFLLQFGAAATYQLSWAIYISDYSRYLPRGTSARSTYWWTFSGAFLGGSWGMLLGAATAASAAGAGLAGALVAAGSHLLPGFGPLLLGLLLLGLTATSALNFYGASLTLLSIVDTVRPLAPGLGKRIAATLSVGAMTVAIALSASDHFIAGFASFLDALLDLVVPWIAITLVDFYLVRRGRYAISAILTRSDLYGHWNWRGLVAYGLGFALAALLHPLAGMALAAAAYRLLCLSHDVAGEWQRIGELDRHLEPAAEAA
jgi:purine-cytosine permease-like protein